MEKYLLLTEEEGQKLKNFPGFIKNTWLVRNFQKMYNNVYFVNENWFNKEKEELKLEAGKSYLLNSNEIINVVEQIDENLFKIKSYTYDYGEISYTEDTINESEFNDFVTRIIDEDVMNKIESLFEQYSDLIANISEVFTDLNT